jgi:hypothetical protein
VVLAEVRHHVTSVAHLFLRHAPVPVPIPLQHVHPSPYAVVMVWHVMLYVGIVSDTFDSLIGAADMYDTGALDRIIDDNGTPLLLLLLVAVVVVLVTVTDESSSSPGKASISAKKSSSAAAICVMSNHTIITSLSRHSTTLSTEP